MQYAVQVHKRWCQILCGQLCQSETGFILYQEVQCQERFCKCWNTSVYDEDVAAAASEGSLVKRAYSSNSNYPVIFEVPVYNSMPSSACQLP